MVKLYNWIAGLFNEKHRQHIRELEEQVQCFDKWLQDSLAERNLYYNLWQAETDALRRRLEDNRHYKAQAEVCIEQLESLNKRYQRLLDAHQRVGTQWQAAERRAKDLDAELTETRERHANLVARVLRAGVEAGL